MALTKDAKFLAEAKKARLEVNPVYADEVIALFKRVVGASPAIKARTKAAVSDVKEVKLAELKTVAVRIASMGKKGQVQFEDSSGKKLRGRVTGQTKITIAGKNVKTKALKAGISCKASWTGDGGTVVALACD
jgi:hypothetical protein